MVTERTIINALILAASFLLVPFIISEWLTVDYLPALCFAAMMGMVVAFFFIKNNLVIFPLLGAFWSGALNFLPLSMTPYHIACIFLILYFITGYVLIRQRPIKLGKPLFLWPMAIVTAIIFYHNHSLSLGSLGGDSEGGKAAILIYMVVVGYFCAINLPSPSPEVFSRIPYYAVLATMISSAPFVITTWVPALAPYLYVITNSVNIESYFDSVTGGTGGVFSKLAAFGPMGSVTQLYLLSHFPIGTWLRPNRWWVAVLSLICFALVASSGYRSDMFGYFATLVIGTWCYYSWRAVILPATALVAITILSIAGSNNLIQVPYRQLPEITQRTLSFLPGDWDPDAIESGKGSDEFRDNIKKVYFEEYAGISPLFGNGFTINTAEFMAQNDARKIGGPNDQAYHEAKSFIEGKLFHTGWLSLYDCVGLVGSAAFVTFSFNTLRVVYRFLFGPRADRRSTLYPLYVWLFCNLLTNISCFFFVFGAFDSQFSGMIIYAIILSHLSDLAAKTETPLIPGEIKGHVEMPRISGAYYGRR